MVSDNPFIEPNEIIDEVLVFDQGRLFVEVLVGDLAELLVEALDVSD